MSENCPQHAAHEQRFLNIEEKGREYNENLQEIVKGQHELRERVTATEQSTRSAHHRLDSQEEQTRAIYQLAFEVKGLSEKHSEILDLLTDHDKRLEHIEQAPGNKAIKAWQWLLVAFAGGCVGMVFTIAANVLSKKLGG